MKKIIVGMLVAVIMMGLSGCKSSEPSEVASTPEVLTQNEVEQKKNDNNNPNYADDAVPEYKDSSYIGGKASESELSQPYSFTGESFGAAVEDQETQDENVESTEYSWDYSSLSANKLKYQIYEIYNQSLKVFDIENYHIIRYGTGALEKFNIEHAELVEGTDEYQQALIGFEVGLDIEARQEAAKMLVELSKLNELDDAGLVELSGILSIEISNLNAYVNDTENEPGDTQSIEVDYLDVVNDLVINQMSMNGFMLISGVSNIDDYNNSHPISFDAVLNGFKRSLENIEYCDELIHNNLSNEIKIVNSWNKLKPSLIDWRDLLSDIETGEEFTDSGLEVDSSIISELGNFEDILASLKQA